MMLKKMCLLSAVVLFGCSGEDIDADGADLAEVNAEIVENLLAADYPRSEIAIREDGAVIVGGDAVVSLEASREMIGIAEPPPAPPVRPYSTSACHTAAQAHENAK